MEISLEHYVDAGDQFFQLVEFNKDNIVQFRKCHTHQCIFIWIPYVSVGEGDLYGYMYKLNILLITTIIIIKLIFLFFFFNLYSSIKTT